MPPHYSNHSVIHSTGILTRDPATISALINIVKKQNSLCTYNKNKVSYKRILY